jgi:hypothetical protein
MRTVDWCILRFVVREGKTPALDAPPELEDVITAYLHNPKTNMHVPSAGLKVRLISVE